MALPTLDATFASAADLPRRQMLAKWLVEELGSGSIADYWTLPEKYLWAKIAVAAGASRGEADYISLPKNYAWSDIYNAVASDSGSHIDWTEKQALGHIAAAYRGDTGAPENLATYIDWPWRYQVASIIGKLTEEPEDEGGIPQPPDFANLIGWFTVKYGVESSVGVSATPNDTVARWLNGVSGQPHLTQTTANLQPTVNGEDNTINQIIFNPASSATGDVMAMTDMNPILSQDYSYYLKWSSIDVTTIGERFMVGLGSSPTINRGTFALDGLSAYYVNNAGGKRSSSLGLGLLSPRYASARFELSQGKATINNSKNSQELITTMISTANTNNSLLVGSKTLDGTNRPMLNWGLQKLYIYNANHSDAVKDDVFDHLTDNNT